MHMLRQIPENGTAKEDGGENYIPETCITHMLQQELFHALCENFYMHLVPVLPSMYVGKMVGLTA